jgi:tetratricopeptide (TPR) repeat protein
MAIQDFDAAIDRNPFAAPPYAARGQSLVATNQFDKAVEDFNAALNVNNRDGESWAWRGVAYERKGSRQEAVESYQRALTAEPGNATAKAGLARVQGGGMALFRS